MRSSQLFGSAVCLASFAAAWPSWLPELDAMIVRDSHSLTARAQETTTATTGSDSAKTTNLNTAGDDKTVTVSRSDSDSKTATKTDKDKSKTTQHHSTEYPANSPPGGVEMVQPATTAVDTALYRVGEYVTLAWNYTSLLGTPTAIDVLATCSGVEDPWTLTANMSFDASPTFVWDTADTDDGDQQLLTAMYTLIVKDSDAEVSDVASAGYLGAWSGFQFGVYTNQPYVNWTEWSCTGCKTGSAAINQQAIGFALTMSMITVLSFTWFVTGLGLQ